MIGQTDLEDPTSEFEILVNYFEENNNFINSELAPAFISPEEVKKNSKNPKFHIIDIRSDSWFEYGHIKNAVNVEAANLLTHFESDINPVDYDKIVLVCYSGQSASYYTSLLRLAGYDNVYNLKWGMSSWREDFAQNSWLKNINNTFSEKEACAVLCTNQEKGSYPSLNTGKTEAKEILRTRLENAFATPYKEYIVKSGDVFENPNNYLIMNYWEEDKYMNGHIPGSVLYQPFGSLSTSGELNTLPSDKQIVVYSSTGQEAAYVVAYLNLIGYHAGNIAYGANGFMNDILVENGWDGFSNKEINLYPVIE
jgi:rhodanese-related sulfurtransferase